MVAAERIDLVVVDAALSAVQQRNLERAWSCKVIDRTGLILEIFGARARTSEGRLQVELAALTYQRSRLVRSWTHLERQRGGFGFLGGPGESQIELDRRRIDDRIIHIRRDLDAVKRTRGLHRAARGRVPYPVIALVGYTNAGKSTLFNRLTGAGVSARDRLFATLDPTMRLIELGSGQPAILSDTVGFVADLPTDLVAAFRATLEEVRTADVVLHVRDVAHGESAAQREDVLEVLTSLDLGRPRRRGAAAGVLEQARPGARPTIGRSCGPLPPASRMRSAARRSPARASTICARLWTGTFRRRRASSSSSSTVPTAQVSPGCTATARCSTAATPTVGPGSGSPSRRFSTPAWESVANDHRSRARKPDGRPLTRSALPLICPLALTRAEC